MPNLPTHIHFSLRALGDVLGSDIKGNLPAYIFGSTAPDIRAITKKDRSVYHFVALDFSEVGEGPKNLTREYPSWSDLSTKSAESRAFIAGYVSHLILDETWITKIFRPYFESSHIYPGRIQSLVMDRAMQLELDRAYWGSMKPHLSDIQRYGIDLDIDFLNGEPLDNWRDWILRLLGADFSWDRLLFMAKRIAKGEDSCQAIEYAEEFVSNPERSIENMLSALPKGIIHDFEELATSNIVNSVNRFMR